MTCEPFQEAIDSHRKWLGAFDAQRLRKWEQLLSAQEEPAIVEACTRHFLMPYVDRIEPAEDQAQGGPDFRCFRGESSYYVEVTCITKSVVTAKTELADKLTRPAQFIGLLTEQVLQECKNKAAQCSGLDAPCLLAIGTLHFQGGYACFQDKCHVERILTSEPVIAMRFDSRRGEAVGIPIQATDLKNAAFCREGRNTNRDIELARESISGLLLCAFSCSPLRVRGVLHPWPKRPFDRLLLPQVEFCKLAPGYEEGEFRVQWV